MASSVIEIESDSVESAFAFFTFRSEHQIVTVIIQMFLLFAGFVVIAGVIYVILLILVILIHHIIFDRDPHRVPNYVKNSAQFSSESEEDEEDLDEDSDSLLNGKGNMPDSRSFNEEGMGKGPSAQRKAQIMDKFITDLDTTRQNIQRNKQNI